eukprot:GHVU01058181.1.p1 GENE.GHVU01058181.1~~GHVU01058181.1.p1  ORF type:complete len:119 (+),score=21.52 GHVU01058181.1:3-359(+)
MPKPEPSLTKCTFKCFGLRDSAYWIHVIRQRADALCYFAEAERQRKTMQYEIEMLWNVTREMKQTIEDVDEKFAGPLREHINKMHKIREKERLKTELYARERLSELASDGVRACVREE